MSSTKSLRPKASTWGPTDPDEDVGLLTTLEVIEMDEQLGTVLSPILDINGEPFSRPKVSSKLGFVGFYKLSGE